MQKFQQDLSFATDFWASPHFFSRTTSLHTIAVNYTCTFCRIAAGWILSKLSLTIIHALLCVMQLEAATLKRLPQTKVIALGIGSGVSELELEDIASTPRDKNVIFVRDFSSLPQVEEQLRNASCTR